MLKKRRPRRTKRNSRYHTGTYVSTKTGQECHYRSSWELKFMMWLDINDDVVSFEYEKLKIKYVSNVKTKKTRNYIPDFTVLRTDGKKLLVEIKPKRHVDKLVNKKKFLGAREWCAQNDYEFMILTEVDLSALGLL